jgi:hypothetical protein
MYNMTRNPNRSLSKSFDVLCRNAAWNVLMRITRQYAAALEKERSLPYLPRSFNLKAVGFNLDNISNDSPRRSREYCCPCYS